MRNPRTTDNTSIIRELDPSLLDGRNPVDSSPDKIENFLSSSQDTLAQLSSGSSNTRGIGTSEPNLVGSDALVPTVGALDQHVRLGGLGGENTPTVVPEDSYTSTYFPLPVQYCFYDRGSDDQIVRSSPL